LIEHVFDCIINPDIPEPGSLLHTSDSGTFWRRRPTRKPVAGRPAGTMRELAAVAAKQGDHTSTASRQTIRDHA
jgi:hypothetical protein